MHQYKDSRKMPYDAKLINDIILQVDQYPEFLPWCKDAKILQIEENYFIAELFVSFKGFTYSYKSKIEHSYIDEKYIINVVAISAPFKSLNNKWIIKSLKNESYVEFFIDFEFESMILDKLVGLVFSIATEKMIHAFETRAKETSDRLH